MMRRKKRIFLRISFSDHRSGAGGQRFSIVLFLSAFLGVAWEKETILMMTDATKLYDMNLSLLFPSSLLFLFFSRSGQMDL
jgi:hypothetical protein